MIFLVVPPYFLVFLLFMDELLKTREEGETKVIIFSLSILWPITIVIGLTLVLYDHLLDLTADNEPDKTIHL